MRPQPQVQVRKWLFPLFILSLLLVVFSQHTPHLEASPEQQPTIQTNNPSPDAADAVQSAWERVRQGGVYDFSADVTQYTIPLPSVTNVGRGGKETSFYLEGSTNLPDEQMNLRLWSQGGSVLQPGTAVEIKTDGDTVLARQGEEGWQEIEDFRGLVAPNGDFMSFISAAEAVTYQGVVTLSGQQYDHYTFDVNGPTFAAFIRDNLAQSLAEQGKLPPGIELKSPAVYADMTGTGELWIDSRGLPLRQTLHLQFPPQEETRTEASITVHFSNFPAQAAHQNGLPLSEGLAAALDFGKSGVSGVAGQTAAFSLAVLLSLLIFVGLVLSSHRRKVYTAVVTLFIVAMLTSPFIQGTHLSAFYDEQAAVQEQQEAVTAESDMTKTLQMLQTQPSETGKPAPTQANLARIQNDDGQDTDQDGLSDIQETFLGTSPVLADSDGDGRLDLEQTAMLALNGNPDNDDDDGDGLTNYEESLLGTSSSTEDYDQDGQPDGFDSDGDSISDRLEIEGFTHNSKVWYLDPLEEDSNKDGLPDTLECEVNTGNQLNCPDTDNDGEPDVFDQDNDGDGIPDKMDLSPNEMSTTQFDQANPMQLTIDGLTAGKYNYVEFQMIPTNRDHLWYAFNVLDWPGIDDLGQMREEDKEGVTFYDLCLAGVMDGVGTAEGCSLRDDNGDVRLVPMLEIVVPDGKNMLPSSDVLDDYGIVAQSLDKSGNSIVYVPLQLTTDPLGESHKAFYGKMIYLPTAADWGAAHEVRLVWVVQALVDSVCVALASDGSCETFADNRLQVIHAYYDTWQLGGLTVREDHGVDTAVIYEDPAVDNDLNSDLSLMFLSAGLDDTFVGGRNCDQVTVEGNCIAVGGRDVDIAEIARRFDHDSNGSVSVTSRWGISNTLSVEAFSYEHIDQAMFKTATEVAPAILDSAFSPYWSGANPISPTLMMAREERFRSSNLDLAAVGDDVSWNGRQLTVDLNAGGGTPVQIITALNWAPYQFNYTLSQWEAYPMTDYWEELERRYSAEMDGSSEDPTTIAGQILTTQLYYVTLRNGIYNLVGNHIGSGELNFDPTPGSFRSDIQLESLVKNVLTGSRTVAVVAMKTVVMWRIAPVNDFFLYLGNMSKLVNKLADLNQSSLYAKSLKSIGVEDPLHALWNNFKNAFGKHINTKTRMTGWAAVIIIASGFIGAALALSSKPGNGADKGATVTGKVAAAMIVVAGTIILLKGPFTVLFKVAKDMKAAGLSKITITKSILKSKPVLFGQPFKATIFGLVLDVAIAWGVFAYQVASNGLQAGSMQYNTLLATTIASTILATAFFLLTLTGIGVLLVLLLTVIDLFLSVLCELAGVNTDPADIVPGEGCFTISGVITDFIAGLLYSADSIVNLNIKDKDDDPILTQFLGLDYYLTDGEAGMEAGNQIYFTAAFKTNLYNLAPSDAGAISTDFFSESWLKNSTFVYHLGPESDPPNVGLGQQNLDWKTNFWYTQHYTIYYPPLLEAFEKSLDLYKGFKLDNIESAPYTLTEGMNQSIPLFLDTSFVVPAYECWVGSCDHQQIDNQSTQSFKDAFIFDIYPATLDSFYAWNWDEHFEQSNADGDIWYAKDHDGDGLLAQAAGGNDPNDSITECGGLCWDTDGDGLSDAYELKANAAGDQNGGSAIDAENADTDSDGLTDYEELLWSSNPTKVDSDGDGLTDLEEIEGWNFTYAPGKITRATSNPLDPDTDADGLDDLTEKNLYDSDPVAFPYHPRVANPNPLTIYLSSDDIDGVIQPGETMVYTATVSNDLAANLYTKGTLAVDIPAVLGSSSQQTSFNLFRGQSISTAANLTASGGSQTVSINNTAAAELQASQGQSAPPLGTLTNSKAFDVVIDGDAPTAVLTSPAYVVPGGFRTFGGSASDPTSHVAFVEVQINGGPWQLAEGAEAWAYTWQVPDFGGNFTLNVRATDVVGNVQSSPSVYFITIDDTPPSVNANSIFNGNPFVAIHRNPADNWVVPLFGSVNDTQAGVRQVEVSLSPNGQGWKTADLEPGTNNWQIDYALNSFDDKNATIVQATDQYTVTIRAVDLALDSGNVITVEVPIRVDTTPPIVSLDGLGIEGSQVVTTSTVELTTILTQSIKIGGMVTDTGPIAAGVSQMEIAFTPIEVVQSLDKAVLLLPLDEPPTATSFLDRSGLGHNGTCFVTLNGNRCPASGQDGRFGSAAAFDNSVLNEEQFIEFTSLNVPESDYSSLLWFKTTCADCGLFSADAGILAAQGHDRDLYLSGGNVCATVSGSGLETICSSGVNYANDAWHMVVQIIGGSGHQLYVDGELAAVGIQTISTFTGQDGINVGFAPAAATDFFNGLIDEVKILNQSLDAATVRGLFRSWTSFAPDAPGAIASSWTYTVPAGLEGLYQIDLTAADVQGNRNDNPNTWPKWRGEIDTLAPRVAMTVTYSGSGSSAQTHYEGLVQDANLSVNRYDFPCQLEPSDYHIDPESGRLTALTPSCTINGWQKAPVFLRACDNFGRCAAAYPSQEYLFWTAMNWVRPSDGIIKRAPLAGDSTTPDDIQTLLGGRERPFGITVDEDTGQLYWAEMGSGTNTGAIWQANPDGTNAEALITGLPVPDVVNYAAPPGRNLQRMGLALDSGANQMYWTQTATGEIWRANLDGSGATMLVDVWSIAPNNPALYWLTLDLTNGTIYWLQGGNASVYAYQIWMANLDGSNPTQIYNDPDATFLDGLAVNPETGRLYWTEADRDDSNRGAIRSANLDGSNPVALLTDLDKTESIALLPDSNEMIWVAGSSSTLLENGYYQFTGQHFRLANQNGSADQRLYPDELLFPGSNCGTFGYCVYNYQAIEGGSQQGIAIAEIPGGSIETTDLALSMDLAEDLAFVGSVLTYTLTVENLGPLDAYDSRITFDLPPFTTFNNGPGCVEDSGTATCAMGTLLEGQETTLTIVLNVSGGANGRLENSAIVSTSIGDHIQGNNTAEARAYYAPPQPSPQAGDVRHIYAAYNANYGSGSDDRIDLLVGNGGFLERTTVVSPAGSVRGLAVNVPAGEIYWTDVSSGTLWRANLDGSNQTQILTGLNAPNGLAVDVDNGWLYYAENNQISRMNVVSLLTEVVIADVNQPGRLALDPIRQLLFWQQGPSISQIDLVTGEISPVISKIGQMESMAVDPYGGQLYWNKYNYYGEIWQANLSGSEQTLYESGIRTPTILTYDLLGDDLLWFDYIATGGPDFRLQSGSAVLENNFKNPKALAIGYQIPVPEPPIITSMPITTAVTNEYYRYQPVSEGTQPLSWSLDSGTPAGVTVNPNFGTVEWMPSAAGPYTINLRVTNAGGTDLQSYTLQVNNPPSPKITSTPDMKGEIGQPYQYRAGASGAEPISWSITGPAGMSIGSDNGLVTWTPGITGTFPVTIEAANVGGTAVQTYTVLVYAFDPENQLYWNSGSYLQRADLTQKDTIVVDIALWSSLGQIEMDQLNSQLYWVEYDDDYEPGFHDINRSDPDGTNHVSVLSGLHGAYGLAIDPYHGSLYWTDYIAGGLRQAGLDGSNPITLTSGLRNPRGLEIDYGNGRLYWLSGDAGLTQDVYLMSANLDGSDVLTVTAAMTNTTDFAIDSGDGTIFWATGSDPNMTIHRANLAPNGSALSNIVDLYTGIESVFGIFVDLDTNLIYWTDAAKNDVWQGDTEGLASAVNLGIDPNGNLLFPRQLAGVYNYSEDFPAPAGAVLSPTNGSTLATSSPVTITGVFTAPASVQQMSFEQFIGGSYTPIYSQTWQAGEVTAETWQTAWLSPTEGFSAVGTHQFRLLVQDWAGRSITVPYTLTLETPPSDLVLPPNITTTLYAEFLSPPPGLSLTAPEPITLTAAAVAPNYLAAIEIYDLDDQNAAIFSDSWPEGEAITTTLDGGWQPPAIAGSYRFRLTATDWQSNTIVVTQTVTVDMPPGQLDEPPGYDGPILDSSIANPADDTTLTNLSATTIEGGAYALESLQALTVTVNDLPIYSDSWIDGAETDVSWSFPWVPPSEGVYLFESQAADWSGRVQTDTHPVTVTVSTTPPAIDVNITVLTTTHRINPALIEITGTATAETEATVTIEIDGGPLRPVILKNGVWRYLWPVAGDSQLHTITVRITDAAGRTDEASETVIVDVVPPERVTLTLGYLDGLETRPITPGLTIYQAAPTLVIDWTASSDGAGLAGYRIGWSNNPSPSLSELTQYVPADPRHHEQVVGDLQTLYAHLVTIDVNGNRNWQTAGPIYIDAPETPDLLSNLSYQGWLDSGATQLGTDNDLAAHVSETASPSGSQRFFLSWQSDALRMAWDGANWNNDGDLFIYLDTKTGGATELYNPYTTTTTITLPSENGSQLTADYLIQVEGNENVTLLKWDGSGWQVEQVISDTNYVLNGRHLDLLLPFSWVELTPGTALKLVAVASEEDNLRLWAAMPDKNPLNSEQVINPLADGRELNSYALTQYYYWPALSDGLQPNAGQYADTDLQFSITSDVGSTAVSYLGSDLLDLLMPGMQLDADLDGTADVPLPFNAQPFPLYDGQMVTYTIHFANDGQETATNVQMTAEAFGALHFGGGTNTTVVNIGNVGAGISGTVTFNAWVDASLDSDAGEITAVFSDDVHGEFEWVWFLHRVDSAAPTELTIDAPMTFVQPITQSVHGVVSDTSGIEAITLEIRTQPGGAVTEINCPDGNNDGLWQCLWQPGPLDGLTNIELRAQATDLFGNVGPWTPWKNLLVDNTAPVIALNSDVESALADGFL
ncbi:MAG: LamG-like jellyroll fold domain-containing protein, partial [Candidatus Promineifilaceae bacterium]